MAHGGYGRKKTGRPPLARGGSSSGRGRGKGPGGVRKENDKKKPKIVSIKNQIRSIERLLKKVGSNLSHSRVVRAFVCDIMVIFLLLSVEFSNLSNCRLPKLCLMLDCQLYLDR